MGRDGEVWVWVMGEHKDDKPIEKIIEDEAIQKAREIAEKEVIYYKLLNSKLAFLLLFSFLR